MCLWLMLHRCLLILMGLMGLFRSDGVVDASFAQYAVTPTSSVADKVSVTDVLVVDAAPLSIDIDGLDGAVVSVVFSVLVISFLSNGKIYLLLSPAPHPVKN